MDGFEVLRRLRSSASDKTGPTPVLVLTARDAVGRVRGLDLGADDYMVKPSPCPSSPRGCARPAPLAGARRPAHRARAVDARYGRKKGFPEQRAPGARGARMGGARSAARQGGEDRLEGGDHPGGRRLGRRPSPNAIEVYVSRLRSKLEPAGIKIRTVRGFGYMLEESSGRSSWPREACARTCCACCSADRGAARGRGGGRVLPVARARHAGLRPGARRHRPRARLAGARRETSTASSCRRRWSRCCAPTASTASTTAS